MSEIEKQCLSLPKKERERLAKVLMESLEETKLTLHKIHDVVVKVMGVEIIGPGRNLYLSVGRTIFTHFACCEGYSEHKIGDYLNKDHSTVHYMKEKMKEWFELPGFYKIENKLYEQVRKELYETDR